MRNELETSHHVAQEALNALKKAGLQASVRNIELFYLHVSNANINLSKAIRTGENTGAALTQSRANELYEKFVAHQDAQDKIFSMIEKFETEAGKIADAVKESGKNSAGCSNALGCLADDLTKTASENPEVARLIDGVTNIVTSIQASNEKLESQLADSSDEISFLRESIETIQKEALTDPLTGVKNRKAFDTSIHRELEFARENDDPLSLVLVDIDFFKRFNDRWGHQTGDQVLRLVAEMMKANVKGRDILSRFGGEEFAIILPSTSRNNSILLADRIRDAVGTRLLKKRRTNENMGNVTLSMGIATLQANDTVETLIERADECLYAAKDRGRNCVISDGDGIPDGAKSVAS